MINLFLILPLLVAGTLHMVVVKKNNLSFLKTPIHEKSFGKNKTWRGLVVLPFFGIIGMFLLQLLMTLFELQTTDLYELIYKFDSPFFVNICLGSLLGFSYGLFELPNSFLKRRLGIKPGEQSDKHQLLFIILDRIDSSIGVVLVYTLWGLPLSHSLFMIPFGIIVHLSVTFPLYLIGFKEKAL